MRISGACIVMRERRRVTTALEARHHNNSPLGRVVALQSDEMKVNNGRVGRRALSVKGNCENEIIGLNGALGGWHTIPNCFPRKFGCGAFKAERRKFFMFVIKTTENEQPQSINRGKDESLKATPTRRVQTSLMKFHFYMHELFVVLSLERIL